MGIQIYGRSKCFDTKKAERYFKERRIPYQYIDLDRYGFAPREFDTVLRGVGGIENLINWDSRSPDIDLLKYLASERDKEDKVYENMKLVRTPVVRNGKSVTVGYAPETWQEWK